MDFVRGASWVLGFLSVALVLFLQCPRVQGGQPPQVVELAHALQNAQVMTAKYRGNRSVATRVWRQAIEVALKSSSAELPPGLRVHVWKSWYNYANHQTEPHVAARIFKSLCLEEHHSSASDDAVGWRPPAVPSSLLATLASPRTAVTARRASSPQTPPSAP